MGVQHIRTNLSVPRRLVNIPEKLLNRWHKQVGTHTPQAQRSLLAVGKCLERLIRAAKDLGAPFMLTLLYVCPPFPIRSLGNSQRKRERSGNMEPPSGLVLLCWASVHSSFLFSWQRLTQEGFLWLHVCLFQVQQSSRASSVPRCAPCWRVRLNVSDWYRLQADKMCTAELSRVEKTYLT